MRCAMCRNGETREGKSVITLTGGTLVAVFRNVPAKICHDCSEEYFDKETTNMILQMAIESFKKGVALELKDWDKLSFS
ncbi:MAG: type II toxin-antitoxin system MqsA family antitoxin [Ignavibacteriaceae bacterium]|nr:type II toxin-antitoxin system MqsA family antitoxin [Ignavibacteriaceae bacterium]